MIRCCFGGRIGRTGVVWRTLGKHALIAQRTIHFISGNMVKAEGLFASIVQAAIVLQGVL
ncbi:hypothetical protein DSECCO2_568140 [anaerobic digester metagenome]